MKAPRKTTKTKPNSPWTLSDAQVAATGLSRRYLIELAGRGILPKPVSGAWDGPAFLAGIVKHYRHLARGTPDMAAAKLRREEARARIMEVAAARAENAAIDLEKVKMFVSRTAVALRSRLLTVPSKIAPLLEGKDLRERQALIRDEVDDVLKHFEQMRKLEKGQV